MTGTNGNGHHKLVSHPRDHRCLRCGRLWFRAVLVPGCKIEIRCPKCGCMAIITDKTIAIDTEIDTIAKVWL